MTLYVIYQNRNSTGIVIHIFKKKKKKKQGEAYPKFIFSEEGQDGGRAGSPNHLSPPNYLENLQIILKIYEFGLRIKERTPGMLQ